MPALGRGEDPRRVFVGQALGDPALGEQLAVEPGVRRLVDDDLVVEVLADLDLVGRSSRTTRRSPRSRPTTPRVTSRSPVDRPGQPDRRLEVGQRCPRGRSTRGPASRGPPARRGSTTVLAVEVERDVGQGVAVGDVDRRVPRRRVGDVLGRVGRSARPPRSTSAGRRVSAGRARTSPLNAGGQDDPDIGRAPGRPRPRRVNAAYARPTRIGLAERGSPPGRSKVMPDRARLAVVAGSGSGSSTSRKPVVRARSSPSGADRPRSPGPTCASGWHAEPTACRSSRTRVAVSGLRFVDGDVERHVDDALGRHRPDRSW